jgi:4-hydroxythreonine-4-phosphate dehydrogenase
MRRPVRIGITLGDVNGIGPEVALKAAHKLACPDLEIVFIGSELIVREQARTLGLQAPPLWDPAPQFRPRWSPGRVRRDASEAAAAWIRAAVKACQSGRFDAMVTAPICKEGLHKAGIQAPGHTEMLAALTGTRRFAMMLFGGPLRVVLVTRHLPLADVPAAVTKGRVMEAIRITGEALPWLGCRRARIAVCGLNPHAGDGGELGREEIDVIDPAVRKARRQGINVVGPVPADAVFYHAVKGKYDAVVAMYHDQGLGPLKMLAFDVGVNVTLGLPIVRTSPDHGTAFDIAGRNKADPSSMIEAIRWAAKLARRKNPWGDD